MSSNAYYNKLYNRPKYSGKQPGSGGTKPVTPQWTDSSIGGVPMTFDQAISTTNNALNADFKANQGRTIPTINPAADLLKTQPPRGGNPPSGGSRRSGGGGGGGGGGATPQQKAAYQAAYNEMVGDNGLGAGYDAYEGRINKAFDPSRINQMFDTAKGGVNSASADGLARLGPILQGLRDRAATARTGVNQAFSDSDARLRGLRNDSLASRSATQSGLNNILGAVDAGEVGATQTPIDELFANARIGNEGYRRTMDVGLADRPAVYEGLNADVRSGISRDQAGLLNQVAMGRTGALNQNNQSLQQTLAQAGLGRLTAEREDAQRLRDFRLEMAQLGIDIPPAAA